MISEVIERIRTMEMYFDALQDAVNMDPALVLKNAELKEYLKNLTEYYESGLWLEDYELDEKGMIPLNLKRGVLSQDGVYDLLEQISSSNTFERTFDNAAVSYENSRPFYMKELYEDIFAYKHIGAESKVLEIGVGTGKATGPFIETGCKLVGIEPGENLAKLAVDRFAESDNFLMNIQTLQDYVCEPESFDMIYSATAFHWIPEEYGYKRVYELLKSGGVFARFAYHAGLDKGRPELVDEIQGLYQNCFNKSSKPKEFGAEDAERIADIAAKYGFVNNEYRLYHTTKDFTADEYMELLATYPDHMSLEPKKRKVLFDGIHEAINRHGGIITVYYTMDLELARKA